MKRVVAVVVLALVVAACATSGPDAAVELEVVATGLLAPIGLAEAPDGRILVAEDGTGEDDLSGGISVIDAGQARRLVSGFPSGRDSGDLSGSALVGVGTDGTVYIGNFGAGHLWTMPADQLLAVDAPLQPSDLAPVMEPLNNVRITNPFDITFDGAGRPVVSDASGNGVATLDTAGSTVFIHRFGQLPDPASPMQIDPVPTGIARVGEEYYVTLTGGCPYPDGSGQLVAIGDDRSQRTVADGLYMPIDVELAADGTIWVLEFADFDDDASCFTGAGYLAGTGRLSRLTDVGLEPVVEGLNHPGAVLAASDGSLYISEVFSGRVLRLVPDGSDSAQPAAPRRFADVAGAVGIDFRHRAFRAGVIDDPPAAMGGGVCWIDYDADGWLDLYFVNSHSLDDDEPARSQLYRNLGGTFEIAEVGAGLDIRGTGCLAADFNDDGWTDLFVTADGPNHLLLNDDGVRFIDTTEESGLGGAAEWNASAAAGDVNGDGWLDIYVTGYVDLAVTVPAPTGHFPQDHPGIRDRLYLGRGLDAEGVPHFSDVTSDVGLNRSDRGLGVIVSDLDLDGDLDIYVANDGNPNRLYLAEPASGVHRVQFVDVTDTADVGDSGSGMGVAAGDYDLDGLPDLLVTNWSRELHALYRGEPATDSGPHYAYSTFRIGLAGLGNNQTGWGATWLDADLDRDLDLFVVNGHVPLTDLAGDAETIRLYVNQTSDGRAGMFGDGTGRFGLLDVGKHSARGAAAGDFDNDGDLDVAVNTIGGPALLLRNEGPRGAWLAVAPEGAEPGTVVEVVCDDGVVLRAELLAGSSYLSTEDPRPHFGLGEASIEHVTVRWPDGAETTVRDVEPGVIVRVERP